MELLSSYARARFSAASVISLSFPVLRCCFRALLHFVRSAARPSQDIVSMSTAFISLTLYIEVEGGRFFSSPIPVHHRWCITECDHHPYGGHDPCQSALSKQSVHSGKTSTRQDISVDYFVQPGNAQYTANASQVECVGPLSCPAYVVHVSLPYSNVLITQAI